MLQKRLEDDLTKPQNEAFKSALIHNVAPFFSDLMLDQFGNYLSQKIFEVASFDELVYLTQMIKPCLAEVSMNVHGTRAVQTLIEVLSKDTKKSE
jgi:Pumilio-family RNA binding repeat